MFSFVTESLTELDNNSIKGRIKVMLIYNLGYETKDIKLST